MTELEFTGLLKPEEEKGLGKTLEEIIDFRKVFSKTKFVGVAIEVIDGPLFVAIVRNVDDKLADRIPSEYKTSAREVVLGIINKDWQSLTTTIPALLNKPIDIPGLDEDEELALLIDFCTLLYNAVLRRAEKEVKKRV